MTGDKYMIIYGALGKGPNTTRDHTPTRPNYVTQRFPVNQGQFQVRYVDKNVAMQSLTGDVVDAERLGTSRTYNISNGKILTDLVGTPIETTVYKVGDKYFGARSNEFGYANYEIVPAEAQLSPDCADPARCRCTTRDQRVAGRCRPRPSMKKLLREPLFHFLLLGARAVRARITSCKSRSDGRPTSKEIRLSLDEISQQALLFQSQWNREPTTGRARRSSWKTG